jgi:hypothetical protein
MKRIHAAVLLTILAAAAASAQTARINVEIMSPLREVIFFNVLRIEFS